MVPGVASSNLVTRPINKNIAQSGDVFIYAQGSDENWKFDKVVGETEYNEVQAVTIWKGAHKRSEVGIYNLVTRPI